MLDGFTTEEQVLLTIKGIIHEKIKSNIID